MVKDVRVDGGRVAATIELTTPACPLKDKILQECEAALRALPGAAEVRVEFVSRVSAHKGVPDKQDIPGVKNIVAVHACKGGVGKSTVAANLAASLRLDGCAVGLFDADIYGPNIPLMMGVTNASPSSENGRLVPIEAHGVKLMSLGFLSQENIPMIWRGPLVHGAVKQLLLDTNWGELDYLVVDLPPGTGDAPLTVIQLVPLAGVVIVTTPQQVALQDGVKGIEMFRKLKVPVLGLVENMSGFTCPHCGKDTDIFSKGGGKREARRLDIPFIGQIPLSMEVARSGDAGVPVVIGAPDSVQAKAFRWMAQVAAGQISKANLGN
jgi:ATP-binding protein involved in chromosome partitioning